MYELLGEAESILNKKTLSVKDYNRFTEIGQSITDDELLFYYDNLAEAFELRLPEIANTVGNFDFIVDWFITKVLIFH